MRRAAALGMPAISLTDHGAMYGAIEFYEAARAHGIKPIIGVEAYVAPRGMADREPKLDAAAFHLVLLARRTLVRLRTKRRSSTTVALLKNARTRFDRTRRMKNGGRQLLPLFFDASGTIPRRYLTTG